METAAKILITGGVIVIFIALLEGFALAMRRQRHAAAEAHLLLTAHQTALLQGFMLLGLSLAVSLSNLSSGVETAAAWLIVAAAGLSTLAGVSNAVQGVTDQFAQRSVGLRLNTLQSLVLTPGVAILLVGVLRGL